MKAILFSALLTVGLVAAGCGGKEDKTTTTSKPGENPLTAPVDYLGAAAKAKINSEKTIDTVAINQAIQMFSTQEGRYPTDLKELVSGGYIRQIPTPPYGMKIVYDPAKGEVTIVKQ